MRKYFDTVINRNTGLPIPGATVALTDQAGSQVTLYTDAAGLNPVNSVSTNGNGFYSFYVPNGAYTITHSYVGKSVSVDDVEIYEGSQLTYDATNDILDARRATSYVGDTAALNAALALYGRVCWRSEIGGFALDSTIIVPPNGYLAAEGQITPIVRAASFTGPSLKSGTADGLVNAGSVRLENLWFVQNGRLGYTGGALANRVTSFASHIEIYGGQAARVIDCGGYGMPFGLSFFHCGGIYIENPFWYGGVWNPLLPAAQESYGHIRAASSPIGHNVNVEIVSPQIYGGNPLGVQTRTIGANNVQALLHSGPQFGIVIESAECMAVRGGFAGGYATSAVLIKAANTYDVLLRLMFEGSYLDESNSSCITVNKVGVGYPQIDGLTINGCDFNGQIVGVNGIYVTNPNGEQPLRRLKVTGTNFRAFLGTPMVLLGVDNYDVIDCEFAGYNLANNTTPNYSSGLYTSGNANFGHVRNCQFGGGANLYTETNAVDGATGLTGNGCMYGAYGDTGSTGDYAYLRARNLAKTGGALVTGTFTGATA